MVRPLSVFSLVLLLVTLVGTACGPAGDDDQPTQTPVIITATPDGGGQDSEPTATEAVAEPTAGGGTEPTSAAEEPTATEAAATVGGVADVDVLWAGSDGQQAIGGTSRVQVSIEENIAGDIRVGFFESEVGGSGSQWQTSGWMAVITSSLLLGVNPAAYEYSFDVAGRVDGGSAGALMTTVVLSILLGDEIDQSMTMTGTINPDGTIGPVGGIPHKIVGAAEAGKTTVLVPAGQRFDIDNNTGQSVDVVQVGQQNGVEVILVPDIYTAYSLLTGSQLPEIESVGTAQMPPDAFSKYRAGITDWYARYQEERNRFLALPPEVQELRVDVILFADQMASDADRLLAEGQVSRAFQMMWEAAALVKVGTQAAELDNLYLTQGLESMVARVQSSAASETRLLGLVQKLEAQAPRTATDTVALIDSASYLSAAQGLIFQGNRAIDNLQFTEYTEDDILTAIYTSAYNYAMADFYIDVADDVMSIGVGFGTTPAPTGETLVALADLFRRGADSNLSFFNGTIIAPFAQANGYSQEIAELLVMDADNTYLTAVAAQSGAGALIGQLSKLEAQAIMQLGAALLAYNQSALLNAKYYSLLAQVDEFGTIVEYGRQTALAEMLAFADERADAWLSGVANDDPVSSLFYYDNARLERQGDAFEQLDALGDYWHSAVLSEVLAIFQLAAGTR